MTTHAEGIISPSIDSLLETTDSKYALVIYGAKRARQINAYYAQLHEGLFEYVGPLVETKLNEKPLSIALREIDEGLLERKAVDPDAVPENASALDDTDVFGDADPTA
ncbi:DNA-directed RNA polymerase subunit omega [Tersicoccus sp. MR15.9]|uniref:DNA-directed RNA polymerase subunit omega n=1 Tax=Tersicoccus mangrovi TaxID=3121635 RepID=UPI002FE615E8